MPRPFWNDGGPVIIVPQAALQAWEGGDPPSEGRVVEARTRWDAATAPATDYDRACDVDPESAGLLEIGTSWGVVLGTAAAQTAHWLPGATPSQFYAVGIEAVDNASPERLRALASSAGDWQRLCERAPIGPEGLLLAHAACRLSEVTERSAMTAADEAERAGAVIGDGLRFELPGGEYAIDARDVTTEEGDYLTFVRFTSVAPAS